jgi:hypothetical protein
MSALSEYDAAILRVVERRPGITLAELHEELRYLYVGHPPMLFLLQSYFRLASHVHALKHAGYLRVNGTGEYAMLFIRDWEGGEEDGVEY